MNECATGMTCPTLQAHIAMEPGQADARAKLYDRLRILENAVSGIDRACSGIEEIRQTVARLELAAAKREAAEGVALWVGRGILTLGGAAIVWWLERYFNGK